MSAMDRALGRLGEAVSDLRTEAALLENALAQCDFRAKFEKARRCLAALYYDSSCGQRSAWINQMLDDPEVQEWIRETQR